MAGLVSRLKRITVSRINAFLETVEDPEIIFPQLVREMQVSIRDAVHAESKALAALKADQRRLDESTGRSMRLAKGAELALRQGDEQLAREALSEQIKTDLSCRDQRLLMKKSESALLEIRQLRAHLEAQFEELKRREKEIVAKSRSMKRSAATYRHTDKIRKTGTAILDEVSRMEQIENDKDCRIGSMGGAPDIFDLSLEGRLRTLERESEIERRLDLIRKKKYAKTDGQRP